MSVNDERFRTEQILRNKIAEIGNSGIGNMGSGLRVGGIAMQGGSLMALNHPTDLRYMSKGGKIKTLTPKEVHTIHNKNLQYLSKGGRVKTLRGGDMQAIQHYQNSPGRIINGRPYELASSPKGGYEGYRENVAPITTMDYTPDQLRQKANFPISYAGIGAKGGAYSKQRKDCMKACEAMGISKEELKKQAEYLGVPQKYVEKAIRKSAKGPFNKNAFLKHERAKEAARKAGTHKKKAKHPNSRKYVVKQKKAHQRSFEEKYGHISEQDRKFAMKYEVPLKYVAAIRKKIHSSTIIKGDRAAMHDFVNRQRIKKKARKAGTHKKKAKHPSSRKLIHHKKEAKVIKNFIAAPAPKKKKAHTGLSVAEVKHLGYVIDDEEREHRKRMAEEYKAMGLDEKGETLSKKAKKLLKEKEKLEEGLYDMGLDVHGRPLMIKKQKRYDKNKQNKHKYSQTAKAEAKKAIERLKADRVQFNLILDRDKRTENEHYKYLKKLYNDEENVNTTKTSSSDSHLLPQGEGRARKAAKRSGLKFHGGAIELENRGAYGMDLMEPEAESAILQKRMYKALKHRAILGETGGGSRFFDFEGRAKVNYHDLSKKDQEEYDKEQEQSRKDWKAHKFAAEDAYYLPITQKLEREFAERVKAERAKGKGGCSMGKGGDRQGYYKDGQLKIPGLTKGGKRSAKGVKTYKNGEPKIKGLTKDGMKRKESTWVSFLKKVSAKRGWAYSQTLEEVHNDKEGFRKEYEKYKAKHR